jgi:hypothetical protein
VEEMLRVDPGARADAARVRRLLDVLGIEDVGCCVGERESFEAAVEAGLAR